MEKVKSGNDDYIWHSVDLFLDFINIFRRLLVILASKVGCLHGNKTIYQLCGEVLLHSCLISKLCVPNTYLYFGDGREHFNLRVGGGGEQQTVYAIMCVCVCLWILCL